MNFLRRYISPINNTHDNDQNTTKSTNEPTRVTNGGFDPYTAKGVTNERSINNNKDHHYQHNHQCIRISNRHNSTSTAAIITEEVSLSTNADSPSLGFVYAPTPPTEGSPTKTHDTITNQVSLPHKMSSLSISLPSSRQNTTDNHGESRRGSKDSNYSLDVIGLTVDTIIDRLLLAEAEHNADNQTIPIFIIFYRKFMTPYKLASALIKRFEDDSRVPELHTPQQQRILSIFTTWLTNYWGDFYHQQTREQLELFIGRLSNTVQLTKSPTMQHIIVKLQSLLMQPTPTEDPDDNWGQKDGHDDDLWDTGNHNKKKDSGYLSTYSGTSPDSPTGDCFRLDDTVWTSPIIARPQQDYMELKTISCDIKQPWMSNSTTNQIEQPQPITPTHSNKIIGRQSPPASTSISTSPSTTLPQFAGGIICMDKYKLSFADTPYGTWGAPNTKPCIPSPALTTYAFSMSCFTSASNNNPVRRTKVTPGPIQPNANPSLHKSKSNDSLASVKLNTTLLLVLSSQEIAEQLTCIEVELFGKIKPREFVRMIWGSNDNKQQPNHSSSSPTTKSGLMASISHFNFISAWVISMIVTQTKLGKRVALLEKFMMVAVALRHLNNYNTLMAILAGINNAAILRLKQTQEGIKKKKIYKQYQSLEKLMSSERSHCSYRMALKASTKCPCIPYLGIHSQDLIALTEANKDMKMDGTIHWDKFRLMGKSIMSITKLQHHQNGYALTPDLTILTWIAQSRILTDEEQYSQSMRIEPRLKTSSMTRLRDLCFKK